MNIDEICKKYKITNYTINPDGSIDVEGNVYLVGLNLTELPLTFNRITGSFGCGNNKLTSLKGCPKEVYGSFVCSSNQLTSLKGGPKKVDKHYWCYNNQLTSLEGVPEYVGKGFCCYHNQLTSLKKIQHLMVEILCQNNPIALSEIENYINNKRYKLFNHNFTYADYLTLDVGTDEEKMLFKLKYL